MYYVNALSVFGAIVTNVVIHVENILYGKREYEICEQLQIISDIFERRLNLRMNYKSLRAKYLRIVCLFVFTIILASVTAFNQLPSLYNDKFFMKPSMVMGVIMTRVRWCQIAMYLNLLADNLNHLKNTLNEHQISSFEHAYANEQPDIRFDGEKIQYFREIYSICWRLITMMSDYFGWSMIAFVVKTTLEFINGSYWIYVNCNSFDSSWLTFRRI